MRMIAILLVFAVLVAGCASTSINQVILSGEKGQKVVTVEVADSFAEWQKGLMDRTTLEADRGMLFVFPDVQTRSFWMKNTLIPLDMLFISDKFEIVDMTTMQPCKADPCPSYSSKKPAMYVLEVNAGYANANNITVGGKAAFRFVSS
jgi:uncharacterized protein